MAHCCSVSCWRGPGASGVLTDVDSLGYGAVRELLDRTVQAYMQLLDPTETLAYDKRRTVAMFMIKQDLAASARRPIETLELPDFDE